MKLKLIAAKVKELKELSKKLDDSFKDDDIKPEQKNNIKDVVDAINSLESLQS
jgi:hypothetical protein